MLPGHPSRRAHSGLGARCGMQAVGAMRISPKGWFVVPVGAQITSQREYVALHKAGSSQVGRSSASRSRSPPRLRDLDAASRSGNQSTASAEGVLTCILSSHRSGLWRPACRPSAVAAKETELCDLRPANPATGDLRNPPWSP